MRLSTLPRGLALDTVSYFTPFEERFRDSGYRTIFRYINRMKLARDVPDPDPQEWLKTLSRMERDELLLKGWRISPVQIGIGKRQDHDEKDGERVGEAAAYNAKELGFAAGATVWCDCEWTKDNLPDLNTAIGYINGWSRIVVEEGFVAGLYVDYLMSPSVLGFTSGILYHGLPYVSAYWLSASYRSTVDIRGAQVTQSTEYMLKDGKVLPFEKGIRKDLRFDADMISIDGLGGRARGMAA